MTPPGLVQMFCGNLTPPFSGYLKLKVTSSPETSLLIYRTSSLIPEDPNLDIHCRENPVLSELCRKTYGKVAYIKKKSSKL
jgi:hypothetical protein